MRSKGAESKQFDHVLLIKTYLTIVGKHPPPHTQHLLHLLQIKGAAGSDMRLVTMCSGVLGNYLIRNVNTTLNSRV